MKILIAGSTGAIGKKLLNLLRNKNHEVYGITSSSKNQNIIKIQEATPVILDVLNETAVFSIVNQIKPDVIVNVLTRLPPTYTPESMKQAAPLDAEIRDVGGDNLQKAALNAKTKRIILQSSGFWYEPGEGFATENDSFALKASPRIRSGSLIYKKMEDRLINSPLEHVILRFGFFYGPGTWFNPDGNVADQVQAMQFPIIGEGSGVWNFVHIEDAAHAIVLSLNSDIGIYNIINDHPSPMYEWLPKFANFIKAPSPLQISIEEGLQSKGEDSVYYALNLRKASNHKAKNVLKFMPRAFDW